MPQVINVKVGSEEAEVSLVLVQNYIQQQQEFKLTYFVVADTQLQDFTVILGTTGLPVLGQRLYSMFCTALKPCGKQAVIHFLTGVLTYLWEVECVFSTQMRDGTDQTPTVNWGGEIDKEHLEADLITRAKIMTTADEPIFMDRPAIYQTLSIHRRETYPFDPTTPARFVGRVNSLSFYGFPPGTAIMMPIEVEEDTQDNQRVCWVTYSVKIKITIDFDGTLMANTWQARPLNCGHQVRLKKGGKPIIKRDKNGQPIIVNLDGDGLELQNSNGTQLAIVGNFFRDSIGVHAADSPTIDPDPNDIGSTMIISAGPAGTNIGEYLVADVATISSQLCWVLDGNPGTIGLLGITWELQRAPIYLYFNRAYPVDFNLLTLGPF